MCCYCYNNSVVLAKCQLTGLSSLIGRANLLELRPSFGLRSDRGKVFEAKRRKGPPSAVPSATTPRDEASQRSDWSSSGGVHHQGRVRRSVLVVAGSVDRARGELRLRKPCKCSLLAAYTPGLYQGQGTGAHSNQGGLCSQGPRLASTASTPTNTETWRAVLRTQLGT